jgi:hypothetical protein
LIIEFRCVSLADQGGNISNATHENYEQVNPILWHGRSAFKAKKSGINNQIKSQSNENSRNITQTKDVSYRSALKTTLPYIQESMQTSSK